MKERKLHLVAGSGVLVLILSAGGGIAWTRSGGGGGGASVDDDLDDVVAIEASIARKKTATKAQPQKDFRAPEAPKTTAMANDLTTPSKPDDPNKPPPKHDDKVANLDEAYKNLQRNHDPDAPVGKPNEDETRGEFDGSKFGTADVSKGDPYWGQLKTDMEWEFPKILSGAGTPVGCIHITSEGKILETRMKTKSGDEPLDDSVERALDTVRKTRNEKPVPVPTHLLDETEKWVCFSFTL